MLLFVVTGEHAKKQNVNGCFLPDNVNVELLTSDSEHFGLLILL